MNLQDRVNAEATPEETNPIEESPQAEDTGGEPAGGETTSDATAILDLTKAEKFTFEGKEWTPDELKQAVMLQSDYTKKTQALAEERKALEPLNAFKEEQKFYDNLDKDLAFVRSNPQAAQQFRETYPEKFHRFLGALGVEQPQASNVANQGLPSEVLREIEGLKQTQEQMTQFMSQKEQETFNAKLEAIEGDFKDKYKYANLPDVYAMAQESFKDNDIDPKQLDKKHLEPFFEASHKYNLDQYKAWHKQELEAAKSRNREAGDIGKGGGVPGEAPEKIALKDVWKHMDNSGQ